jgi:hypothetical protein
MYDAIYTMSPICTSACLKDDSGNLTSPSTGASSSNVAQLLATLCSTTTDNNIQFFFYNSGLDGTNMS